jgi:multicomponent Na+:H+ antiporter subunit D
LFVQDVAYTHTLILALAGLTMITGVLGAVSQNEFRRILSFHIVSQIGYMIFGLGLFTATALAGSIFYIVHHIIVKTNLFLVSGVVHRIQGTYELKKLGGLYSTRPALSILFLIPALSLAGTPPLSGFVAKFTLVRAGLESQSYILVATALAVGLLTLFSMTKIWAEAFWKESPGNSVRTEAMASIPEPRVSHWLLVLPIAALALITILIGVAAEPLYALASRAAQQLIDPAEYIQAVLGRR